MAVWVPQLASSRAVPVYLALVQAIADDIGSGRLGPGTRLPPQRELARTLGISVGAVTRAYDAAARRGLVLAHVGRGTFVLDGALDSMPQAGIIDLSINLPPPAAIDLSAAAITSLRRMEPLADRLAYAPPAGHEVDRRAAAEWLGRFCGFEKPDWRNLICCGGTQSGMAIALAALVRPGDVILCEAATFSGARTLAGQQGFQLRGVDMDHEGARPDALDRAAAETGARFFYTLPTLHNPTARTMGRRRREEIAKIAQARDLIVIEDDVYAAYARDLGLPPLVALMPDRTLYLTSLSKVVAPGLRVGFLAAPAGEIFERCLRAARALTHSPSGINFAIATEWIRSGRAEELAIAACAEAHARTAMGLAALGDAVARPRPAASLHLWLPMLTEIAERTAARAMASGLRLAPPGAFLTSGDQTVAGLRLCLGAAANRATLAQALCILKEALAGNNDYAAIDPL
ncbi:PLP-dependent aminotransferase family protein [Boseaceae bacterium BT-24-1]|nr:PLP-dependent aminotransferase family protein [Boseaceae bacterium BT-24-1]